MIKPCKCCGEPPIIQRRYDSTYVVYCCQYYCDNCGLDFVVNAQTEEAAIDLWNEAQEETGKYHAPA